MHTASTPALKTGATGPPILRTLDPTCTLCAIWFAGATSTPQHCPCELPNGDGTPMVLSPPAPGTSTGTLVWLRKLRLFMLSEALCFLPAKDSSLLSGNNMLDPNFSFLLFCQASHMWSYLFLFHLISFGFPPPHKGSLMAMEEPQGVYLPVQGLWEGPPPSQQSQ